MKGLFLEAAGDDDVTALVELERRCQSHPWTAAHFRAEISPGTAWVLVLRRARGRALYAYCAVRLVADELHVLNLAVAPEHRRLGLARSLLGLVLAFGAGRGARAALLEVRRSNAEALALYGSLGFAPLLVRLAYYREPTEDAIVLRRELPAQDKP